MTADSAAIRSMSLEIQDSSGILLTKLTKPFYIRYDSSGKLHYPSPDPARSWAGINPATGKT